MLGWLTSRIDAAKQGSAEESRHWYLECSNCGHKRSYWALGGLRYRAAGTGKSKRAFCSGCNSQQRLVTIWYDTPDPADLGQPHGWWRKQAQSDA